MPQFQYRAVAKDGTIVQADLEAVSRQHAFHRLEDLGLTPVTVSEQSRGDDAGAERRTFRWRRERVPFHSLEAFTRQLSSLLAAGVPLSRALWIIQKETSIPVVRGQWKTVHDLVIDGSSLADALAQFPETFSTAYTAMVRAGETGGFLDRVLKQIADFQSREKELRSRIASSLIYPAVLLVLAAFVLVYLLVFFIPRFRSLFAGFGGTLPLLTRLIVGTSEFLRGYGFLLLAGVVLLALLLRRWLRTDAGRRVWERSVLRPPVIGKLVARFAMVRFCRMLGTLLESGVPLMSALGVARRSVANRILMDTMEESIERVRKGESLAAGLAGCQQLFPGSVLEMIAVAEESGRVDQELLRIAETAQGDLDRSLKTAVALAEPLMLFVMAGFIGTIFVGMIIPIFTIQEYIK